MQFLELFSGDKVPVLGLGTWKMAGDLARASVQTALECGYRHVDCARIYENEADVGRALELSIRGGRVSREELWVTSKLWNDAHHQQLVRPALESSLHDLQLDYLDLYLMHWPIAHQPGIVRPENGAGYASLDEAPLAETWLAMRDCQSSGLCRNIGVSNFNIPKLERLIADTGIVPAVNQVEAHPYLQQRPLLEYCDRKGIRLTAYSPLGSGDRPDAMKRPDEPVLFHEPLICQLAKKYQVSVAAVLIAWAVNRGTIVIPKSSSEVRIRENLAAGKLDLADDDMRAIAGLDRQYRFVDGKFWECEGSPYTADALWNE
jgi:alcohol dehydrogenase (NADP+)